MGLRHAIGFYAAAAGAGYPAILDDGNTVAFYDSQLLSTITKDGSNFVSRWNDRLGSGHDLIQATGTKQPLWSATGILFDGIDNFMKTATFTINQPTFIYAVLKQITWTIADRIWDGNSADYGTLYQNLTTPGMKVYAGAGSAQKNLTLDTFGIIRVLLNGASSKFQINSDAAATGNFGIRNMAGFTLGANGSGTNYSNIEVKEIIMRRIADASGDETAIYNYLATKYGFPTI
ncbi:MAG TPA: hypothetical protein VI911_00655 [Patescibacteria group bacterium]|nr:hypothetical protein [Patescibacteria group bacterium]